MAAIEQICLPEGWQAQDLWPEVARRTRSWLQRQGVSARDAVLLLPFAALLNPARAAFAAMGDWQPRVETVLTLSASLGPPAEQAAGRCTGDLVLDRLSARALLLSQPWARRWLRDDAAGFEGLVARTTDAAQQLRQAAFDRPPAQRAEFWAQAREVLRVDGAVGSVEAALLHLALEWAHASEDASADRLHAHQPAAWVLVRLGGQDAAAELLVGGGSAPALRIVADPPAEAPFGGLPAGVAVSRWLCEDFEAESQAAALQVQAALRQGCTRVGLVALDREQARRTVALLERLRVPLVDETGWVLATTPAAASLMALLRAAARGAGEDARLEWLKTWPGAETQAVDALEAIWRGRRRPPDEAAGRRLWEQAQRWLAPLSEPVALSLAQWLQRLALAWLEGRTPDAATDQVAAALRLPGRGAATPAWIAATQGSFTLAAFTAWVQATLEGAPFLPLPDEGAPVVITPLARAYGRGFDQVVVPAADARHLAGAEPAPGLIPDRAAQALGLPHAQAYRQRQVMALAQLLRTPRVALLRRHREGDEPLADSPLVEWWLLACAQASQALAATQTWVPPSRAAARQAVVPPRPAAGAQLPAQLSATQLDALRACPYRFFARAVLRLDEPDELDTGLEKRDYGEWLHAVLFQFHHAGGEDETALQAAAEHVTQEQMIDEADLLPWRASFETLAPAYVAWWQARREAGWRWVTGEEDKHRALAEVPGLQLRGRIDRLDAAADGRQLLLDYKTGGVDGLQDKLKLRLEDTQLAFYAALVGADAAPATFGASYLALDDRRAPLELPHKAVGDTAAALLAGLALDWTRLQAGAAMPALGEGSVCETCEMRGLCRRDHWGAA
jgi:ATP-dependent helicase/nuclease subunit B